MRRCFRPTAAAARSNFCSSAAAMPRCRAPASTKTVGGKTVWIQAGEDLANRDVLIDDIVADFYRNVGWITLPILLVLLITDIAIFRRALRPLRQASEIAERYRPGAAPTSGCRPAKFRARCVPLVSAVNQALDRLEEGFRVQRDFTADAAHELRTPLSVLRTRIDTSRGSATCARRCGRTSRAWRISSASCSTSPSSTPSSSIPRRRPTCARWLRRGRRVRRAVGAGAGQGDRAVGRERTGLGQGQCRRCSAAPSATSPKTPSITRQQDRRSNSWSRTTARCSVLDHGPGITDEERKLIFRASGGAIAASPAAPGLGFRSCSASPSCIRL